MRQAAAPFTARKMLYAMLAFFGVVIAANVTMMSFALKTHTGVVVPNSYVASQDFNDRIADAALQRERGWQAEFSYEGDLAAVRVINRSGEPVEGLAVAGVIGRPVSEAHDRSVQFQETGAGRYVVQIDLEPGEWRLDAVAALPGDGEHRMIRDIYVRGRKE